MSSLVKLTLLSALISGVCLAQEDKKIQQAKDEKVWVEFGIPVSKNGSFENAIDEQILTSAGISVGAGWQPLAANNTSTGALRVLKNFGLVVGGSSNFIYPFKNYLYKTEAEVISIENTCYTRSSNQADNSNDRGYWNGHCYRCSRGGGGYCQDQEVYGRDRFVKYERGALLVGAFIPVQVADKLRFEAGANYRLHFINEGIQTDHIKHSTEASLDLVAGAAWKLTRALALTGSYEYSVKGRKYKAYQFGVRVSLGRYF